MKTFWTTVFLATDAVRGSSRPGRNRATNRYCAFEWPADSRDPVWSIERSSDQRSADRSGKRDPRGADKKHRCQEVEDR